MRIPATPAEGRTSPIFPVGVRAMRSVGFVDNSEPSLAELMADDVVRRLMARDGVRADDLLSLMEDMRIRLG